MAMLPKLRFLETPTERPMSFLIDLDTHDELQETRESLSPPTYEERMDNHRRRRSLCPGPEDLQCVEIPASEFHRAKKRIKTVDSKLEDMSIPNTRSDGLIETAQKFLQGPTDLGSLNRSSGSFLSGTYTGGFTAINKDRLALSSAKENAIPGVQTGGSSENDQEWQKSPWSTWRSAEQVSISGIRTGGFTAINRDWSVFKTLRSSSKKRISSSQTEGSPQSNKEWQTPNKSSLWSSEGISISPIQTGGIIETSGVGVATIVNTSLNESNGPIDLTSPEGVNRSVVDLTSPEGVNRSIVEDRFPTDDKSFESLLSDGDPSPSECSTDSYSDGEPEYETGRFQGTTVSYPRNDALQCALREQNFQHRSAARYRLVLWADGSGDKRQAAEAVSWRDPQDPEVWKIRARSLPFMQNSLITELHAIAHGLEVAIEQISGHQNENQTHTSYEVLVFSDCLSAIEWVGGARTGKFAWWRLADVTPVTQIIMSSAQLRQLGALVELHWVPGHSGILGNELSDVAARYAAKAEVIDIGLRLPWVIAPGEARERLRLAIIRLRVNRN